MNVMNDLKPFFECKDCLWLGEYSHKPFDSEQFIMAPFCEHYELHFDSVRQIDKITEICMHYKEFEE